MIKKVNKDYFDKNNGEMYKILRKDSMNFANFIVKSDVDCLKRERRFLISLPAMEAGTSAMFGVFSYATHSVISLGLAIVFGVGTIFVSGMTLPFFKANKDELTKIRQKRDRIYNDLMQVYDDDVKVKRKIRS